MLRSYTDLKIIYMVSSQLILVQEPWESVSHFGAGQNGITKSQPGKEWPLFKFLFL